MPGDVGADEDKAKGSLDVLTAVVLSAAALASAYASYQGALWDGEQAAHYTEANTLRTQATRAALTANQSQALDIMMFNAWLGAMAANQPTLAGYYRGRFRPQLVVAFEPWLALHPLQNPGAPATPFLLPAYRVPERDAADALERKANKRYEAGQRANDVSDSFVLATVILANALFFGGISQVLKIRRAQFILLSIATVSCLGGIAYIVTLPPAP